MDLQSALKDLNSPAVGEQIAAAEWLGQNSKQAGPAAGRLLELLSATDADLVSWCSEALETMGPPPDSQLAPIAAQLRAKHADTVYWAATLLGRAGSRASQFRTQLADVAQNAPTAELKNRAGWAVGKLSNG